jgi:starch phosphorylase
VRLIRIPRYYDLSAIDEKNDLDPKAVRVELYAVGVNSGNPVRQMMKLVPQPAAADGGYVYCGQVQASRPAADYEAMVIPNCDSVAVPLEAAQIPW